MTDLLPQTRRPDIIFHPSGRVDISARASRALDLCKGDIVSIAIDKGDVYLYVKLRAAEADVGHSCRVAPVSGAAGTFRIWCRSLYLAVKALSQAPLYYCAEAVAEEKKKGKEKKHPLAQENEKPLRLPCGSAVIINNRTMLPIITKLKL